MTYEYRISVWSAETSVVILPNTFSCRQNKSQAFSGYPIFPVSVTTWQCVFSVKKDFSLALFARGEERRRQAGSYLQPLQMIYCEKSVLLHYARHRFVWWRDVHRVHTPRFVCLCCFLYNTASDSTAKHLIWSKCVKRTNGKHCLAEQKHHFGKKFAAGISSRDYFVIPLRCTSSNKDRWRDECTDIVLWGTFGVEDGSRSWEHCGRGREREA